MSKADRRIDSATCLPLSGFARAHSSVGQSYRLITGWSLVRVQVGPSPLSHSHLIRLNSIVGKIR